MFYNANFFHAYDHQKEAVTSINYYLSHSQRIFTQNNSSLIQDSRYNERSVGSIASRDKTSQGFSNDF